MDLICLFDLDEKDRLCIERGEVPKNRKISVDEDVALFAHHRNYLSSKGFGDMSEEDMRKSGVFDDLEQRMSKMNLKMDVEDADVEVSDVDEDWEEAEARRHLKDLSKKVVVPEKQKKVKVIKPKYKKKDGQMYGQL